MRSRFWIFGALGLLLLIQEGAATLMLGSLLMALKGGIFAGKMGLGGLMAMALAGTQTQQGIGSVSYQGRRRAIRSVTTVSETPLAVGEPANGTHLSVEKLAETLNNITNPSTRRMMRQLAVLDQLSCLPKVLCGLNTRAPSSKTSVINDYGYLIKFLFERDEQDDDEQEDEKEEEDDEDDDAPASRAGAMSVTKSTKRKAEKKKPKPVTTDDIDDEDSQSEEVQVDDKQFDELAEEDDDKFDELAQEELLQNEPEMLSYVLTEMRQRMKARTGHKSHKKGLKKGGYPTYQPDHSELPGYDPESYQPYEHPTNPDPLNTDTAQQILAEKPFLKGNGFKFGSPKLQFKIGASDKADSGGLFGSLLPSFSFESTKSKGSSKAKDDPFAGDPFFDNFKRRSMMNFASEYPSREGSAKDLSSQRINSKFNPKAGAYIDSKREQLQSSTDPITKYQVAAEVGQKTKSARQCRLLFTKCPYETSEILTMIHNVKNLVNKNAQVGDKEVSLKQSTKSSTGNIASASTLSDSISVAKPTMSTITTGSAGNVVNVQSLNGNNQNTIISHQLDTGDKVEIMLKFKPKEEVQELGHKSPVFQIVSPPQRQAKPGLTNSTNLLELRKAIQAIQAIHAFSTYYNRTDLPLIPLHGATAGSSSHLPQPTSSTSAASILAAALDANKPAESPADSVESGESSSKSSEEAVIPHNKVPHNNQNAGFPLSTRAEAQVKRTPSNPLPSPVQEDEEGSQEEDDDEEDDDEDEEDEEEDEEEEEEEEAVQEDDSSKRKKKRKQSKNKGSPPVPPPNFRYNPPAQAPEFIIDHIGDSPLPPRNQAPPRLAQPHQGLPPKPKPYKIVRPRNKSRPSHILKTKTVYTD